MAIVDSLYRQLAESLPGILFGIAILIVGWIVAIIFRAALRRTCGWLKLNERIRSFTGSAIDVESGVATGGYLLVLLLALIGFFDALKLRLVSQPLQQLMEKLLNFLPNLIAATVLALVAWILATVLRKGAAASLSKTTLDEKLSREAGMKPISQNLGNVLYGLVLLLFIPAILGTLGLRGLLEPIQGMVDEILGMVPNIFAALILGGVGWFVAKILRNLVSSLLAAAGTDKLGERAGIKGTMTLSNLIGLLVFIFVFVPALIAALNALQLETISRPATEMLGTLMGAIPALFAASLILGLAFFVAKLVGNLVENLLGGMGFDRLPEKLGLKTAFPEETTPSRLAGRVVVFFILLFASVEAANVLGFGQLSDVVAMFIQFGGQVLLGVVILAVGLWISNLAHAALSRRPDGGVLAGLARFTILGVVFAMGLHAMDIADSIVNLAFGLSLGSAAVAIALSFGLGGREAAGKQMEHWLSRMRGER